MLNKTELLWLRHKYNTRTKSTGNRPSVDDAHDMAIKWVDEHAVGMLPSIRHGLCLACVRFALEGDPGERKNLSISIDALLMLGRNVRDARHE